MGVRDHQPGAGEAALFEASEELGGVEVDVREAGMVERAAQEGLDLLIEPLAHAAYFDFDMPLAPPNASTRASPLRVEMPLVRCRPSSPRRSGPCRPGGAVRTSWGRSCPV